MTDIIMRSLMFVPGHNEKLLTSAAKSDADVLLLDLEDSVQPESNKPLARKKSWNGSVQGACQTTMFFPG